MPPTPVHSITEQEEALFAMWRTRHDNLVCDGVPMPSVYDEMPPKVIFVLREPNFNDEPKDYDIRAELRGDEGYTHDFWKVKVAILCRAVSDTSDPVDDVWNRTRNCDIDATRALLGRFGFVQLRKVGGAATADHRRIRKYVDAHRELLREQIAIYQPDILIACGLGAEKTSSVLKERIFAGNAFQEHVIDGCDRKYAVIHAPETSARPIHVIETFHPSHRKCRRDVFIALANDFRHVVKTHCLTA